jgi:hypothetical protein
VRDEAEAPPGDDLRIELLERSRRRVSSVGERRLAGLFASAVDTLELLVGHVELATDLQYLGRRMPVAAQAQGDGADGSHLRRDVVTLLAVAAGQRQRQAPGLVSEAHRDPVDLGIANVVQLFGLHALGLQTLDHPVVPRLQVVDAVGVVDRHHANPVPEGREALEGLAADPLGWAVGVVQIGVRPLQPDQLGQERVVLRVRHDRLVFDVVRVIGALEQLAQLPDPFLLGRLAHGTGGTIPAPRPRRVRR